MFLGSPIYFSSAVSRRAPGTERLLVIRFSSFGDIVQAMSVPQAFLQRFPTAHVDWLVREDYAPLLTGQKEISKVIPFARRTGVFGLLAEAWKLSSLDYTHVYDAHSNVRSALVRLVFGVRSAWRMINAQETPKIVVRSKERARRWLFFRLRWRSVLPLPYLGSESFLWPLKVWGLQTQVPAQALYKSQADVPADVLESLRKLPANWIAAAPSAAWEMKRWPTEHWLKLIDLLPDWGFVFLGGPEDQFIQELAARAPDRSMNLAGRLSLQESAAVLEQAPLVIANDTGLLHVADQMARPTLALIGPSAFGYPSHPRSQTLETHLWCKPCSKDGRGSCVNDLYKRCLVEITPEKVADAARNIFK